MYVCIYIYTLLCINEEVNILMVLLITLNSLGLPRWISGKESACQCRSLRRCGFDPWVRNILWRREWQSTLVFLPEKSMDRGAWWATVHGVAKESDTTEHAH